MSTTKTRRSVLDVLLGRDELKEQMAQLEAFLQKQGVDRKESKKKGALEDVIAAIDEAIAPLTDNPPEGIAQKILALVMGMLNEVAAEPAPAEEVPTEEMQADGEVPPPDNEEDKKPVPAMMELTQQVKDMAADNTAMVKDMEQIVKAMLELAKANKALEPLAARVDELSQIGDRLEALEKSINARPRQASQSISTLLEGADQIKREIQKGTNGNKTVLGFAVKE